VLRAVDDGVEVTLWVVPGASSESISGRHGNALKVRVTPPPERGRATEAAVNLLSTVTGRPASLVSGGGSRRKRVLLHGAQLDEVRSLLEPG
jgi:uncharacterized protein (TIGR00251 family)